MSYIPSLAEIKQQALRLGWDDVGICKPTIPEEDIKSYLEWLNTGLHAELSYMENTLRCHPDKLFPGAKTALIFITHYKQEKKDEPLNAIGKIASYAHGRDYHHIHRARLKKFIIWLEEITGQNNIAKGFSDSTPILEKALAVQAGLGWFGKNTLLIHRKFGTFTLLSGLLTTLELPIETTPVLRLPKCGTCNRCIDACPTKAIISPYKLDAAKCLSYHLIESKKPIPKEIQEKNPGFIFGCDICQDVCPHNVRPKPTQNDEFTEKKGIGSYLDTVKLDLIKKEPERLYGTPLQRRGVEGLIYSASTLEN